MRTIEITVSPTGETKIESKNFQGGECQDATRHIEAAMGCRISEVLSTEYFNIKTESQSEVSTFGS